MVLCINTHTRQCAHSPHFDLGDDDTRKNTHTILWNFNLGTRKLIKRNEMCFAYYSQCAQYTRPQQRVEREYIMRTRLTCGFPLQPMKDKRSVRLDDTSIYSSLRMDHHSDDIFSFILNFSVQSTRCRHFLNLISLPFELHVHFSVKSRETKRLRWNYDS